MKNYVCVIINTLFHPCNAFFLALFYLQIRQYFAVNNGIVRIMVSYTLALFIAYAQCTAQFPLFNGKVLCILYINGVQLMLYNAPLFVFYTYKILHVIYFLRNILCFYEIFTETKVHLYMCRSRI